MKKKTIHIINGPNLNLIGTREPEIYGKESLVDYLNELDQKYIHIDFHHFQSNHEGLIIDYIHKHGFSAEGIIINPGAFSHSSYAIADAIKSIRTEVIEVHISNIYAREDFRKSSITASSCAGIVSGFGLKSYEMALNYFLEVKG